MTFYSLEEAQREMPIGHCSTHWSTITEIRYAHNMTDFELLKKTYDSVEPKTTREIFPAYFTCTKRIETEDYKVDGYIYDGIAWYPVQKEENYNYEVFCWKPIKEEEDN